MWHIRPLWPFLPHFLLCRFFTLQLFWFPVTNGFSQHLYQSLLFCTAMTGSSFMFVGLTQITFFWWALCSNATTNFRESFGLSIGWVESLSSTTVFFVFHTKMPLTNPVVWVPKSQLAASPFNAWQHCSKLSSSHCFLFKNLWRYISRFLFFWNASLLSFSRSFSMIAFMTILVFRSNSVFLTASPSAIYRNSRLFSVQWVLLPLPSAPFSSICLCTLSCEFF